MASVLALYLILTKFKSFGPFIVVEVKGGAEWGPFYHHIFNSRSWERKAQPQTHFSLAMGKLLGGRARNRMERNGVIISNKKFALNGY